MKAIQLSRYSAAGNTFLAWDLDTQPLEEGARSQVVRLFCDGFTGFYTDGLFFLKTSHEIGIDCEWDFYNSDGSRAEMCGNAARAALLFHQKKKAEKNKINLKTAMGPVHVQFVQSKSGVDVQNSEQNVEVKMPKLKKHGEFLSLQIGKKQVEHYFINTGVPHLVVEGEPNIEIARLLRQAAELGEPGANITFFEETAPGEVSSVTYERGVENFTLSCGTGAVAAAYFSKEKNPLLKRHSIEMPGGLLEVDLSQENPRLSGNVQFEFDLIIPDNHFAPEF